MQVGLTRRNWTFFGILRSTRMRQFPIGNCCRLFGGLIMETRSTIFAYLSRTCGRSRVESRAP